MSAVGILIVGLFSISLIILYMWFLVSIVNNTARTAVALEKLVAAATPSPASPTSHVSRLELLSRQINRNKL